MNISNPHFEAPSWLILAVAGPVLLALLFRFAARKRNAQLAQIASPRFVNELCASHSPARRTLKEMLLMLAVVLTGVALARPQWGEYKSGNSWLGSDVVFALDCSRSMLASDVTPNRLQRAKFAIMEFVRTHSRGRVGLVAFAGSAFLQCPLTLDYDAFTDSLQAIDDRTIPLPGTDIGRALTEASRAMPKESRHKLVVLVTDGEDLEKSGIAVAKSLATNGVVVFTIGVGSPGGSEIRIVNETGQTELLRDRGGEVVVSRLDEETLRGIAKAANGNYFPLGPLGEGLAKVRSAVEILESAPGPNQTHARGVDRFYFAVAAVLALMVIESVIGTRRKSSTE